MKMLNKLSKLTHQAGMPVVCPVCYITFYRAPSHVERVGTSYCSRACAFEGRKIRVVSHCRVCGKAMELTPSMVERQTTCSKKCSTVRRTKGRTGGKGQGTSEYISTVKDIARRSVCVACGVTHGPWAIRGLSVTIAKDGEKTVNKDQATLWCKHCHLKDVAPLGSVVRDAKKKNKKEVQA